jgi:hypothetical protein
MFSSELAWLRIRQKLWGGQSCPMPHSFCSARIVGQPILAAAGFQPALAGHEGVRDIKVESLP